MEIQPFLPMAINVGTNQKIIQNNVSYKEKLFKQTHGRPNRSSAARHKKSHVRLAEYVTLRDVPVGMFHLNESFEPLVVHWKVIVWLHCKVPPRRCFFFHWLSSSFCYFVSGPGAFLDEIPRVHHFTVQIPMIFLLIDSLLNVVEISKCWYAASFESRCWEV